MSEANETESESDVRYSWVTLKRRETGMVDGCRIWQYHEPLALPSPTEADGLRVFTNMQVWFPEYDLEFVKVKREGINDWLIEVKE